MMGSRISGALMMPHNMVNFSKFYGIVEVIFWPEQAYNWINKYKE